MKRKALHTKPHRNIKKRKVETPEEKIEREKDEKIYQQGYDALSHRGRRI